MKRRLAFRIGIVGVAVIILVGVALVVRFQLYTPSPTVFDPLMTEDLVEAGCTDLVPFTISRSHADNHLHYRVDFHLDTDEPRLFAIIDIEVRRASLVPRRGGIFLGPGGGGDRSVVRTGDGRHDIIVQQGNRGMDGVKSPVIHSQRIAEDLARRYESRDGS